MRDGPKKEALSAAKEAENGPGRDLFEKKENFSGNMWSVLALLSVLINRQIIIYMYAVAMADPRKGR